MRLVHFVFRGVVELSRSDRMLVVAREGGFCRPAGAGLSGGDGTQRSRAGLSSVGPPGLGPGLRGSASCRWWTSWFSSSGGLNHEAHKGHERKMRRIQGDGGTVWAGQPQPRCGWVGVSDVNPGLASFLGQPWARGRNAVGVDGGNDGARGLGLD